MTVADRFYPFNIAIAAGSSPAAPVSTRLPFDDVYLRRVDVRVPPGPYGAVGFYLTLAGTVIVPWGLPPVFIVANDEALSFDVNTEDNGGLTVVAYNVGAYPHTLYFRFLATPMALIPSVIKTATIHNLNG